MIIKKNNKIAILGMYCLLEFGYIKLLLDFVIVDFLQYSILIFVILGWLADFIAAGKLKMNMIFGAGILFTLFFLGSRIYTPSVYYANLKVFYYMISIFYFMLSIFCFKKIYRFRFYEFIELLVKCNTLVICALVLVYFQDIYISIYSGNRLGNTDMNPIWMARFFIETVFYYYILKTHRQQKPNWIYLVLMIIVLYLCGSKGPIVGGVIAFLYYNYLFLDITKIKTYKKIFFLMLVILLTGILYIRFGHLDFIQSRFSLDRMFSDADGYRMDRYKYAIEMIIKNPIIGYGIGSWAVYYTGIDSIDYPHNIFLEIWFELGIIPLVLVVFIVIYVLKNIKKYDEKTKTIASLFVLQLTTAMFSGSLTDGNRGIYIYIGALCVLKYRPIIELKEKINENNNCIHKL